MMKAIAVLGSCAMVCASVFCAGVFWTVPGLDPLMQWGSLLTVATSMWLLYCSIES